MGRRCTLLGTWWALLALAISAAAPALAADAAAGAQRAGRSNQTPLTPVVRFAPEKDYGPFVFVGADGKVQGLSVDMLRAIQARTGLEVDWLPAQSLRELLDGVRRGRIDLLSSLRPTPERGEFLEFSAPYVSAPAVVLVRRGAALPALGAGHVLDAFQGRPVAVGEGYAVETVVRRSHPDVAWRPVPDDRAALLGLREGRYAAAVVDVASASFVGQREGWKDFVVAGEVGFTYELSFAVRRGQTRLLSTIDAGLREMPAAERQAIVQRWMAPLPTLEEHRRAPIATAVGVALIGVAAIAAAGLGLRSRIKAMKETSAKETTA